jgi:hypothetical protein
MDPTASPRRQHLLTAQDLARTANVTSSTDLTRHRGEGNGIRVHLISFGFASVAVLALMIVVIALATRMM